jgi:hypothetical protein
MKIGKIIKKIGYIENKKDIFHFSFDEVNDLLENGVNEINKKKEIKIYTKEEIKNLIIERKLSFEKNRKLSPPMLMSSYGEDLRVSYRFFKNRENIINGNNNDEIRIDDDKKGIFYGLGVSSGTFEGVARVILDPLNETLNSGFFIFFIFFLNLNFFFF